MGGPLDLGGDFGDGGELRRQLGAGDVVVADPEGLEDGLVHESAGGVVGLQIDRVDVFAEDVEAEVQRGLDVLVADVQAPEDLVGLLALALDAGDFLVEKLVGDAALVSGAEQQALFVLKALKQARATLDLLTAGLPQHAELVA